MKKQEADEKELKSKDVILALIGEYQHWHNGGPDTTRFWHLILFALSHCRAACFADYHKAGFDTESTNAVFLADINRLVEEELIYRDGHRVQLTVKGVGAAKAIIRILPEEFRVLREAAQQRC